MKYERTIRRILALVPVVAIVLATAQAAQAADVNAATCSQVDVQSAITRAASGDRVLVPGGSCTWATTVTVPSTKSLKLQGAGAGVTVITQSTGLNNYLLYVQTQAGQFTEITGFTFNLNNVTWGYGSVAFEGNNGSYTAIMARVHHNNFDNIFRRGIATYAKSGSMLHVLIDHNSFRSTVEGNAQAVSLVGATNESRMFAYSPRLGSANTSFIEDNVWSQVSRQDGCVEAYNGSPFVMRFNQLHTCLEGSHGADSSDGRGPMTIEVYHNSFDLNGCLYACSGIGIGHWRSGQLLEFNNSWASGYSPNSINLDNIRSGGSQWAAPYLGWCSGTNPVDGNDVNSTGRHCIDQIGTLFTSTLNGSHTHVPAYFFGNRLGGTNNAHAVVATGYAATRTIVPESDFYNEAGANNPDGCTGAFNGTCGVGIGTLAARPTTCRGPDAFGQGGVGYWSTDQGGNWNTINGTANDGALYRCTATNTWTLYYVPFTYPHPLTQGGTPTQSGPNPPSGLHVVSSQ